MLTGEGDWEQTARSFLFETDHEYIPYIAIMLYAGLAGEAQDEAQSVLEERWLKVDPKTWKERLRAGDETAWREMLIGYYLKKVKRDDIFRQLENDSAYAGSDLRFLSVARTGLLCEAYFYDALLARVRHDRVGMMRNLQRVLGTGQKLYFEYEMAKFLLKDSIANPNKPALSASARIR